MADDTVVGVLGTSNIIVKNEDKLNKNLVVQRKTNGTDMFPGCVVSEVGETFPAVDLAEAGELWLGIAWRHSNPADIPEGWMNPDASSPDYTFATATYIDVILPHGGELEIAAFVSKRTTNANNITGNEILKVSATTDGKLDVTTTPAYPLPVGRAVSEQAITVDTTDARVVVIHF